MTIKLLEETIDSPPPMAAVKEAMKPLRDLRDNWISHADLQRALAGAQATVILAEIKAAADAVLAWLRQFGDAVGLPTSEPVDQGTWDSAVSLTAALRDAEAVHMTYIDLLRSCGTLCPSAVAIDHQLTAFRVRWEDPPFAEADWLAIRARVFADGLSKVRNSVDPESPYMAILLQMESPEGDITTNTTDRRVAARIKKEAALLLRELEQRGGQG
ncbi:MAG: hypothetical protein AABO58_05015 [Acidobacteriota bacterium]